MQTVLLAVVIGLGIGVVVGALGAGGGILAVPVLVYLLGQEPHAATASSLVIVGITSLASIRHHAKVGNVLWRAGVVFGGISVVGAVIGSRLSAFAPPWLLMTLLGAMLVVVSLVMARRAVRTRREEKAQQAARGTATDDGAPDGAAGDDAVAGSAPRDDLPPNAPAPDDAIAENARDVERHGPSLPTLIVTASFSGLLTGFFGVGGGFIVVPMLVLALGLAMRSATGTSLLVMIITTVVSLLARLGTSVDIDWAVTLAFAVASAIGGVLGGPLSARARPSTLTALFATLLGAVAVGILGGEALT